ncbi:unknown [Firmicutes bacterium CAG:137]|nr:unknown [Firmicutes bacterium CAG:137]
MKYLVNRISLPKLRYYAIQKAGAKISILLPAMNIFWYIQNILLQRDNLVSKKTIRSSIKTIS